MYVALNASTCVAPPLPSDFGDAARAEQLALTQQITAAQGAFDLSVYRPDLGPNGWPWGEGPDPCKPITLAPTWLERMFGGAVSVMAPLPGKVDSQGCGYPHDGIGGGMGPNGSPSNPRVVDFPTCTPLSVAARVVSPQISDDCYSVRTGDIATTPQYAAYPLPEAENPAVIVAPANPPARPMPTGDVCADLKNGTLLQSNVPVEQVYQCSVAGYVGVAPSPLDTIQAELGLAGLGACGDAGTVCAGNPQVNNPPGWGPSPAARARGNGGNGPLLALLIGGAILYYGTKGNR